MSVNTYVSGIRNKTARFDDMVDLKMFCDKLTVSYPEELIDYFNGTDALEMDDKADVIKEALEVSLNYDLCGIVGLTKGNIDTDDGMIVDLSKLPDDITKLRIYMS